MDKKFNPLTFVWNVFSVIGGLFGLSSMLDAVVDWRKPVSTLIAQYHQLVRPIFHFLFSWLPFQIPPFVQDYVTVGFFVSIFVARSYISMSYEPAIKDPDLIWRPQVQFLLALTFLPFWPYLVVMIINHSFFTKNPKFAFTVHAGQWILASLLVLIVAALLNSRIL